MAKGLAILLGKPEEKDNDKDDDKDVAQDILDAIKDDDAKGLSLALQRHYAECSMGED